MKKIAGCFLTFLTMLYLWLPSALWAGGEKSSDLVVVADTRVLHSSILKYFSELYNTNIVLFALWAVILTAFYGCLLGVLMDLIMSRTGLDLKSRKIVEH